MAVEPGQTLLHYRIVEKIGEGGMGVVWKATDTTLGRDVAIKVVPQVFADDAERLARFEREAKTLASLNQPNIAAVYGLHEAPSTGSGQAGTRFLAMELVPGENLQTRLARGPLAVDETIRIGTQIAEALEAAHVQGVIHRDLKPANVVLKPDGNAKVLDFGLAKATLPSDAASRSEGGSSLSPTVTSGGTAHGMILGTAAYMSPEQAKGQVVDRRSDLWSFGAALFEMLTARPPFRGESISETLAEVIKGDPDWNLLPPGTPPALRRLLERCLAKDPRWRLADAADARIELQTAAEEVSRGPATGEGAVSGPPRSNRLIWPLAAIAVVATVAAAWLALRPGPQVDPLRLEITLPEGETLVTRPAISPDGQTVAFSSARGQASARTYVRRLSEFEPQFIDEAGAHGGPFFSPDGLWLGYVTRGAVWKVAIDGGTPVRVADSASSFGATWVDDGSIVYAPHLNEGLWRVGPDGSPPERLTQPDGGPAGYAHVFPHALPDGRVLYTIWGESEESNYIVDLETKESIPIRGSRGTPQSVATYVDGHLLVGDRAAGLNLAPVDLERAMVTGPARKIVSGIFGHISVHLPYAAVSRESTLVYAPGDARGRRLVWVDGEGRTSPLVEAEDAYFFADLSHDGRRAVVVAGFDVIVFDLERGTRDSLTSMEGEKLNFKPLWMPGDERILFSSNRSGTWDLYTRSADGAGEDQLLLETEMTEYPESFSPDGVLSMAVANPETGLDIWTLTQGEEPEPFVVNDFSQWGSRFSPDGSLIAYTSNESGRTEIFVQVYPAGGGGRQIVSTEGGWAPAWSGDGKRLYYAREGELWAADVISRSPLRFGRPVLLFRGEFANDNWNRFDVAPDGERFLMVQPQPESIPNRLRVVRGWSVD